MAKPPKRPREIKRASETPAASLSSPTLTRRRIAGQAELWSEPLGDLAPMPAIVAPCLPTLVDKPPAGERWQHEIKWDGYRLIACRDKARVRLLTRNGHDWTERFPAIAAGIEHLPVTSIILDGEAVVLDQNGVSGFGAMQQALSNRRNATEAILYAFDVLYLDGRDLRESPLESRRRVLADLLQKPQPGLHLSEHLDGDGEALFRHACRMGLEGIVSKRRDRPYRSGRREEWAKTKCVQREEFVVAGYLRSTTGRNTLGALVLGFHRNDELIYAGRVGTGFSEAVAGDLMARLKALHTPAPAFLRPPTGIEARGVLWVRPELVAEVEHRGWTSDNLLRHSSFKGLREDRDAADVERGA